ncbi:MAG TPA: hypothetical protein VLW85_15845 [Myxococcales bacterium]|nr:hypothetical protein [Myxococcales bacterium]
MQRKSGQERLNRIQLIGRVQLAYEQVKDAMQRYGRNSPAVTLAKRRFAVLNRALAMLALEEAGQPA